MDTRRNGSDDLNIQVITDARCAELLVDPLRNGEEGVFRMFVCFVPIVCCG